MTKTNVVIETPRGSRAKYAYDPGRRTFVLKRILPEGMAMPFDFGFIPGTLADDGDPLDVIVISELTTFPGCEIECRIVGAQCAEQLKEGEDKPTRNDRLIAIPCETRAFKDVKDIEILGTRLMEDLAAFFVQYHALSGDRFKPLERLSPKDAGKLIEKYRHD